MYMDSTVLQLQRVNCYPNGTAGWIVDGPMTDSLGVVWWGVWWSDGLMSWCAESNLSLTKAFPIVEGQLPTATFTASPTSISTGSGAVTFKWTTRNATSVGLEEWSGYRNLNDSLMIWVTNTQTGTLIATNVFGMAQTAVQVPVTTPPIIGVGFYIGRRVMVSANVLFVRPGPSQEGYPNGTEATGQQGVIISGSVAGGTYTWWNIRWDDGKLGWSAEAYLSPIEPPPPPYSSIADRYDSLLFTSEGFDPLVIQGMYIRMGCPDTTMGTPRFYFVRPQPVGGLFDTTYIDVIYHFTKPAASVEK
jgi:hypothetical protein